MARIVLLGLVATALACGDGPAGGAPDATPVAAPDTVLSEGPAAITSMTAARFLFSSTDTAATFECRLDAAAFAPCTSPLSLTVGEGEHTFTTRARNAGGSDDSPASLTWRVDLTPPDTALDVRPTALMEMSEATFTFSATEGGSFECSLDGAPAAACTSGVSYSELALGDHNFSVRAFDLAANPDPMPATWSWTVTRITPNTRITKKPEESPWRSPEVIFEFDADLAGAHFECRLNAEEPEPCTSPVTYDLEEAEWTFEVTAIDADGRRDPSPARHLFTIRFPFW